MTIALLIDADNISASRYPEILAHAQALGEVPIRRAYFSQPTSDWGQVTGLRLCFAGGGKNSADLLMTVDGMELALRDKVERFVIASSDGGFSYLALRLREYGLGVHGVGEGKAPDRLRDACTKFRVLPSLKLEKATAAKPIVQKLSRIDEAICSELRAHPEGIHVGLLGGKMGQRGHKLDELTGRNWWKHLDSQKSLYDLDPRGPDARVRLRRLS